MPNERLRAAMARSGHTAFSVAEAVGVDPKTVQRWIDPGRRPHRKNAATAAALLESDVFHLWPPSADSTERTKESDGEMVTILPRRSAIPLETWPAMFEAARHRIEIMVYAALFLHEQIPGWNELLRSRAEQGCRVRILIGDPDCAAVRLRGEEESFGHGIESRCRLARLHYEPLCGVRGIHLATHATTLYNSIYRADEEMYVNTHLYGANAYANPVFHLRRKPTNGLFDAYAASFDAVWRTARPVSE